MTQTQETHPFQAEVKELLDLVIHSLYEHREIFLRELISNASDAIDKLRFESLTHPEYGSADGAKIQIGFDLDARTLSITDDGIGMNHDDLVSHLGTIARSGTRAFLSKIKQAGAATPELIGQFGVGFYASFMVAEEVVVDTLKAGETQAWRWRSRGQGEFQIEPGDRTARGTRITLHLKQPDSPEDDDPAEYLDEFKIREIVKRYSDFVAYPIQLEPKDGKDPETLNTMRPLWTRSKDSIERTEYDEFYRRTSHDWTPPREVIHFKAEGTSEYTALMFIPGARPSGLFDGTQGKSRLSLYVKRVLIMEECPELLPAWLRFVRGLVDSPDLPLNVSRETVQQNATVRAIKKRLKKRVLESLATMLAEKREEYRAFWADFGAILKEGIWYGEDEDKQVEKLCLFETTHGAEPTTLAEYVARKQPDQKQIWYLTGERRATLESSPHLEAFTKRGLEVLLFVDAIDEWLIQRLPEFEGLKLTPVDRGALELEAPSEKEAREALDREHRDMLAAIESKLGEGVKSVRFSTRLSESPAVLLNDEHAPSAHMARLMRAANQDVPDAKRILELNPDHALVKKLQTHFQADPRSEKFNEWVEWLHGQALLAEGSPLADPARFARLSTKLVLSAD
ncbi:MAG: molecular chaperone HtpG [Planctomycetes bacterium]|nr:molecular chaperone HtpG [Planctomycetota bacterium]